MRILVSDIVSKVPEFSFIKMDEIAISATYCRGRSRAGLLAYLLPLRYRDGSSVTKKVRQGQVYHYGVTPVHHEGQELLYIIYFMLPRFLRLSFREKLNTAIHELYHINPDFNGDLRRLPGRSHLHGNSLKDYDKTVRELAEKYLSVADPGGPSTFLKGPFDDLKSFHIREPRPKLIHVESVI